MKKTVTINISGIIFHIEEDAYDALSRYLATIKGYFEKSEGRDEIMGDIEMRIAEILKGKISDFKQVVTMQDVEEVIDIMGKPEEFAEGAEAGSDASEEVFEEDIRSGKRRRVFRDPDNEIIGGVWAGIANHFDIDPLWLRLGLVGFTLLGGAGILIYIILWIVIPQAKTTAEKLEMRGEKVNVKNIRKTVEDEMGNIKEKAKNFGDAAGKSFKTKGKDAGEKLTEFLVSVGTSFMKVFGKLLAIVLIISGVVLSIVLFSAVFGVFNWGWTPFHVWIPAFFSSGFQMDLGFIALLLIVGIPVLMLIYGGFRLLLGIREKNRIVSLAATILWFSGLGLAAYLGFEISSEFRENARIKEVITVRIKSDTLYLRNAEDFPEIPDYDRFNRKHRHHGNSRGIDMAGPVGDEIVFGFPDVSVEPTDSDSFRIEIIRGASGSDKKSASERAGKLMYRPALVQDSLVTLSEFGKFGIAETWRGQSVKIIIRVPKGKAVFFSRSMKNLLFNVDNIHNTWDGNMINRTWLMTEEGLDCVNCRGIDKEESFNRKKKQSEKDHPADYVHFIRM
jgi:phage shock protein PspC (stress-responsive transcriptional regulator)